jgi:hypothetical protein
MLDATGVVVHTLICSRVAYNCFHDIGVKKSSWR